MYVIGLIRDLYCGVLRMVKKQLNFMGHKQLVEDTRTGQCRLCLRRYPKDLGNPTVLHHTIYEEGKPLAHTVELCGSCHTSLHRKGRNHKGSLIHSFLFPPDTDEGRLNRLDAPIPHDPKW